MKVSRNRGPRARLRSFATRAGLGGLALGLAMFSAGSGAVLAEGAPGGLAPALSPPAPPSPEAVAVEPPGPAAEAGSGGTVPAGTGPAGTGPAGAPEAAPQGAPLFPEDRGPAPNVSNISLTGEAYVVRQDVKAPLELLLGRYPRATVDVARDLTTAFGAFADPGFLGRMGVEAETAAAGDRNVSEPAWAECVFPKSPLTPDSDVRSPGQGAGPSATARCQQGAASAAGSFARDPGAGATGGVAVFSAGGGTAHVDATSNTAGATATLSSSSLENVNLAEQVKIASITNEVRVLTNGRPGGAAVDTVAVIHGLSIGGRPVELPSDSLAELGPALSQLAPVLTPLGVLTFDVIPEQKEAAPDGTSAAGRAAQLLVTLEQGETTASFGVGFASARGRTILSAVPRPVVSRPPIPVNRGAVTTGQPLRPLVRPGARNFAEKADGGPGGRSAAARAKSRPGGLTLPDLRAAPPGGLPTAGLNLVPPARTPAQNAGDNTEPYGGDGPWIALIGGSVIALGLARYLAYSTAVHPVEA